MSIVWGNWTIGMCLEAARDVIRCEKSFSSLPLSEFVVVGICG